jgi:hypothetical protein
VSKTYLMFMSAQRLGWLAGIVSLVGVGADRALAADTTDARRAATPAAEERPPVNLGLMFDAGVPDGAIGALVLRPARWLRLHAGGGTNTVAAGYRGGLTVLPFGWGPSLSVEAGHYRDGGANGLMRSFVGATSSISSLFSRVGYSYYNAQLGFEVGQGAFQFFVHGGLSFMRATLPDAAAALMRTQSSSATTTITLRSDPVVRIWAPSVKLGVLYTFGGAP